MKKLFSKDLFVITSLVAFVALTACLSNLLPEAEQAAHALSPMQPSAAVIVIDPGHGGEDGGASSASGVRESDINLSVAHRLDLILTLFGVKTQMIRDADISIHDSSAESIRQKKVSDLKNRVRLVNSLQDAVLVSIHQNFFPETKYYGAQVFFTNNAESKLLGESIQTALNNMLKPEKQRKAAKAPNSVYLLNKVTNPAVLIECGFLSNERECALLQTPAHQIKLAAAMASVFINSD